MLGSVNDHLPGVTQDLITTKPPPGCFLEIIALDLSCSADLGLKIFPPGGQSVLRARLQAGEWHWVPANPFLLAPGDKMLIKVVNYSSTPQGYRLNLFGRP